MVYDYICDRVTNILQRYDERDPVRLCRAMDIELISRSFGDQENAIKGFFFEQSRVKVIFYNSDLPCIYQKIIIAHELGHAVLHADSNTQSFHDICMFDRSSELEKEANLFASDLLIPDSELFDTLENTGSFFEAASLLNVPPELLEFKLRIMKHKGYSLQSPIFADSAFLKNIDTSRYKE